MNSQPGSVAFRIVRGARPALLATVVWIVVRNRLAARSAIHLDDFAEINAQGYAWLNASMHVMAVGFCAARAPRSTLI